MLKRNMGIKEKPERWQDNSDKEEFDVVVCFEERVFDLVLADMREKNAKGVPVLVINLDVRDSHEDAVNAAPMALKLCEMIEKCEDWECEIDEIVDEFEAECGVRPLYSVMYY
jgi:RNA polymerase II subunit A C-terminal domain phosphatase SSU72